MNARSKGIVLMFHRVSDNDLDPWGLNVSATNFRNQMSLLANRGMSKRNCNSRQVLSTICRGCCSAGNRHLLRRIVLA